MLRIMFGCYKNKAIKLPRDLGVRPTLVRARRMIFDIIRYEYNNVFTFLDVFAGSGIMGLESLSNGASKVIFFDINKKVIRNLKDNIQSMPNIQGTYSIICTSALTPPEGSPIDIIFIDPPYDKYFIAEDVIKKLYKKNWINENTLIILELPKKNTFDINQFNIIREKTISSSIFKFLKMKV